MGVEGKKGKKEKKKVSWNSQLNRKSTGHCERKSFIGGSSVQYVDLFCTCRTKKKKKKSLEAASLFKRTKDMPQLTQSHNALPTQQHKFYNVALIGHLHNYPLRLLEVQRSSRFQASGYVVLPPRESSEKWDSECGLRSRPNCFRTQAQCFTLCEPDIAYVSFLLTFKRIVY